MPKALQSCFVSELKHVETIKNSWYVWVLLALSAHPYGNPRSKIPCMLGDPHKIWALNHKPDECVKYEVEKTPCISIDIHVSYLLMNLSFIQSLMFSITDWDTRNIQFRWGCRRPSKSSRPSSARKHGNHCGSRDNFHHNSRSKKKWPMGGIYLPGKKLRKSDSIISNLSNHDTWWLIPLSKWVVTPVINGISRVNPLITGVITHLLSGMSHQVYIHIYSQLIPSHRWYTMLESAGWDFQKGFRRHGFCVLSFKWSSQNTATKHPTKQHVLDEIQ